MSTKSENQQNILSEDEDPYVLQSELQKCMNPYADQDEHIKFIMASLISSNKQLQRQIFNMLQFCRMIKRSILIMDKTSEKQEADNMSESLQPLKDIPEIVLKDITSIERLRQVGIQRVANKLKVLVSKTMQKQSSKLKYNHITYVGNLLQIISSSLQFNLAYEKLRVQIEQIRQKFNVVSDFIVLLHKCHPSIFVYNTYANFYISFYNEGLLFIQDRPLPFNGNLLFVPIMTIKNRNPETGKTTYSQISNDYINQLNKQNCNWEQLCFQVIIKQANYSSIRQYFCACYQKKGFQSQTVTNLRKIRCFVYFSLLFNYLKHAFGQSNLSANKKQIKIALNEKLELEINTERKINSNKIQSNPKMIRSFMNYFQDSNIKRRRQQSKCQIISNLTNYLLCTLANFKYNIEVPKQYMALKPKYIYVGNKRVQI